MALQRYGAGLKELRKKVCAEHQAPKPQKRLAWLPEEAEVIKGNTKTPTSALKRLLGVLELRSGGSAYEPKND